jgi:glycosyltransferase involved in cell wall biosynthesis
VGGTGNDSSTNDNLIDFGFVEDESQMAELYSIADLFVIPSLEDNLPNTVIESLLCGTPVVGFKTGGIPDMIENGINGALAEEKTAAALRDAIVLALDKIAHFDRSNISATARAKYGLEIQAHAYSNLFRKLLKAD